MVKSKFIGNVALLASGAVGAQVITMAFAPIITRLYGPEAFGVLGTFMATLAIATPLAAFSYPIAIVLPKEDAEAIGLAKLSLGIAFITSSLMALILLSFLDPIRNTFNLQAAGSLILLLPLIMLFSACLAIMRQWAIRKKLFKIMAKVEVVQAFFVNSAKIGIGIINPSAFVLIMVATVGSALHALLLSLGVRESFGLIKTRKREPVPMLALAKSHADFPLYRTPQIFINAASQGLPVIMLASFFGPAAAGYYALGRTVMTLPSSLIAQSVGEVFYPRITEAAHHGESQYRLIVKATLGLVFFGILPFSTVFFVGPWLFSFVFGPDWVDAGEYARWLSLMLFCNFINRPSVAAVPTLGLQRGLVVYEIFSTGSKILALYLGFVVFNNDQIAVALFGIFGAAAYLALIVWITTAARNADAGI
jgi:O-antigen/teichoic acid export membrane protein